MSKRILDPEIKKKHIQISSFLKELRFNFGYTQAEVAEGIQVHRNTISRIENNHDFNLSQLIALANFYDVPVEDIVKE